MVLQQMILWRRLDLPGHDACALLALDNGWRLQGTALFCEDDEPCELHYTVECDNAWLTRTATVNGWVGKNAVELVIAVEPGARWRVNGVEQPEVTGLVDLDLSFTPATNLIQLRRLDLAIGQAVDAPTAYLLFPKLTLERLEHRYKRVAPGQYDYHASRFDYTTVLQVSDQGFVTNYPPLWTLEALR